MTDYTIVLSLYLSKNQHNFRPNTQQSLLMELLRILQWLIPFIILKNKEEQEQVKIQTLI